MNTNRSKDRTEKRSSVTSSQTISTGISSTIKRKNTKTSMNSKISRNDINKNSYSASPRKKLSIKHVNFKTNYIQVIEVESYKLYNGKNEVNDDTTCKCLIS